MAGSRFSWTGFLQPVAQLGMSSVRQAEPTSWVDIPCHVIDCDLDTGRDRFTDRFDPGTASIIFANDDGWGDLIGPGANAQLATANAVLRPGRPIRIGINGPWTGAIHSTRWLFRGYIESCTPRYDPVDHDTVEVACIDALGEVGHITAPAGAFQGANETVNSRIHRVLTSVGWWDTKRSIAPTTTQVQGTSLGSQAINLVGQAADSGGGVVFGDVNGNIVYRDLDWMLYPHTVNPDDCIGNVDPAVAPLPGPPHIDPRCGPVYMPPCPPFTPPPPICVDAARWDAVGLENNGTLIEQGDTFRLFVVDGELFYTWMGRTWDMGPFSGTKNTSVDGRVTVCVKPPPPTCPTPPCTPTRCDKPGSDGKCPDGSSPDANGCCTPTTGGLCPDGSAPGVDGCPGTIPPTDALPPAGATLLAWNDGGYLLVDPVGWVEDRKQTITVGPVAPVKGCMLLVLVNAIRFVGGDTLQPFSSTASSTVIGTTSTGSITGGGLTWQPCIQAQNYTAGDTEVFGAVAVVRDQIDPFNVTIDWNGDGESKEHIVSVWQIVDSVADLYDRMTLGGMFTYGAAAGLANVSPPPGDGPYTLKLANNFSHDVYTKPEDILLAQSLAEQVGPPYGAIFDDTQGAWTIPAIVPPLPEPAPLAVPDAVCDDFERADGPLGPGWVTGPGPPWTDDNHPMVISSGAAIGTTATPVPGSPPRITNMSRWASAVTGAQSIEVTVENVWPTSGGDGTDGQYLMLFTNITGDGFACNFADFRFSTTFGGVITIGFSTFNAAGDSDNHFNGDFPRAMTDPVKIRFVSSPDGTQDVYVDDVLAASWLNDQALTDGGFVGMGTELSTSRPSLRILEACIGGVAAQRKASWSIAGRNGFSQGDASWTDVNIGDVNIVSSEVAVDIEMSRTPTFEWGVLDWGMEGSPTASLGPGGRVGYFGRVGPNSIVLVYVGVECATDVSSAITVTSPDMTFALAYAQPKGGSNRAQGAVWWAKTPSVIFAPDVHPSYQVHWSSTIDKVSWVAYEITNAEAIGTVGGTTAGNHTSGSVDGPAAFNLPAAPATTSVVLAFLAVGTDATGIEEGSLPGTGWIEDLELLPNASQYAYINVDSRDASIDPSVSWTDLYEGATSHGTDAVMMAVEVTPATEFAGWQSTALLTVGGARDAFSGPIFSATGFNPDGSVKWQLDPMEVVMPS